MRPPYNLTSARPSRHLSHHSWLIGKNEQEEHGEVTRPNQELAKEKKEKEPVKLSRSPDPVSNDTKHRDRLEDHAFEEGSVCDSRHFARGLQHSRWGLKPRQRSCEDKGVPKCNPPRRADLGTRSEVKSNVSYRS